MRQRHRTWCLCMPRQDPDISHKAAGMAENRSPDPAIRSAPQRQWLRVSFLLAFRRCCVAALGLVYGWFTGRRTLSRPHARNGVPRVLPHRFQRHAGDRLWTDSVCLPRSYVWIGNSTASTYTWGGSTPGHALIDRYLATTPRQVTTTRTVPSRAYPW